MAGGRRRWIMKAGLQAMEGEGVKELLSIYINKTEEEERERKKEK